MALTPWVSDTDRPNPYRSNEEKTPVTIRRCQLRVSAEPTVRLEPTTTAGPSAGSTSGTARSRNPRSQKSTSKFTTTSPTAARSPARNARP